MDFSSYFSRPGAETLGEFGQAIGHSADQLRQWRYGNGRAYCRRPPPAVAAKCEQASKGLMTCEEIRPDLVWARVTDETWLYHWRGRPLLDVTGTLPPLKPRRGRPPKVRE